MANFNSEFKKILENIENNIKDKESLEVVRIEIFNLYNMFFEAYTNLEEVANNRIAELAQSQLEVKEDLTEIRKSLNAIEKEIYMDEEMEDENYDVEIKCPYCNKTFTTEMDEIAKDEIVCPECNNTIELDWGDLCCCEDDGCDCCSHGYHECHCEDEDDDM